MNGVEQCGSCGADLYPSTGFVWHWPDEDCRGVKDPYTEEQWGVYATSPRWENLRRDDARL